jgi:hypothetical protein
LAFSPGPLLLSLPNCRCTDCILYRGARIDIELLALEAEEKKMCPWLVQRGERCAGCTGGIWRRAMAGRRALKGSNPAKTQVRGEGCSLESIQARWKNGNKPEKNYTRCRSYHRLQLAQEMDVRPDMTPAAVPLTLGPCMRGGTWQVRNWKLNIGNQRGARGARNGVEHGIDSFSGGFDVPPSVSRPQRGELVGWRSRRNQELDDHPQPSSRLQRLVREQRASSGSF